jgi:hypothetical protein
MPRIAVQRMIYNGQELAVPFGEGATADNFLLYLTRDELWFAAPGRLGLFTEYGIELGETDPLPGGDSVLTLRPAIVKA